MPNVKEKNNKSFSFKLYYHYFLCPKCFSNSQVFHLPSPSSVTSRNWIHLTAQNGAYDHNLQLKSFFRKTSSCLILIKKLISISIKLLNNPRSLVVAVAAKQTLKSVSPHHSPKRLSNFQNIPSIYECVLKERVAKHKFQHEWTSSSTCVCQPCGPHRANAVGKCATNEVL